MTKLGLGAALGVAVEGVCLQQGRTIISLPGFARAAGHRWVLLMTQLVSHVPTPTAVGVCSSAPAPIKSGWHNPLPFGEFPVSSGCGFLHPGTVMVSHHQR